MTSIANFRNRLPFVVFILVLILLVALLGFVCVCMSDHPGQAVDRVLQAVAAAPALLVIWGFVLAVGLTAVVQAEAVLGSNRASPATLQRFLF